GDRELALPPAPLPTRDHRGHGAEPRARPPKTRHIRSARNQARVLVLGTRLHAVNTARWLANPAPRIYARNRRAAHAKRAAASHSSATRPQPYPPPTRRHQRRSHNERTFDTEAPSNVLS